MSKPKSTPDKRRHFDAAFKLQSAQLISWAFSDS